MLLTPMSNIYNTTFCVLIQLCLIKKIHFLHSSNLVVKALFPSKCIDVVQRGSEIYSCVWVSARHCGMETNQHRWKRLRFFLEKPSKLLVSILLSTTLNTINSLVCLFKNRLLFPFEFCCFNVMLVWICRFDWNFFSLSFKSKCRPERVTR